MKKKLFFAMHNLDIGGIEKSMINLLNAIDFDKYDVTVLLQEKRGMFLDDVPSNVHIKEYRISKSSFVIFRKIINRLKVISYCILNYHKYDYSCAYATYDTPSTIIARFLSKNTCIFVHGDYTMAYDKKGLVENVENQGAVTGLKNVGGIIGTASSIKISGARNYAEVVGSITVGGIAASLGSNSELKNGSNFAKITGKEYTAGIVGFFGNSYCPASANYGIMQNVLNRGEVTGTNYIAGVVGQALCVTIMESANTDSIIGDKYLAGIIGHAKRSNVESIYNKGAVFGSTNVGGIIGYNEEGDGDSLVGLMIGYNYNTTMADYYYLEQGDQEPFGLNNGGGVATPKAADEMKSDDFAELLGDEFTYDSDLNDGYPVLKWEME